MAHVVTAEGRAIPGAPCGNQTAPNRATSLAGEATGWNRTPLWAKRAAGQAGVPFHKVLRQARCAVRLKDAWSRQARAGNGAPLQTRIICLVVLKTAK